MRKDISSYVKVRKNCVTKKDNRHKEYGNALRVPVADLS
jgi:hypothetical protein